MQSDLEKNPWKTLNSELIYKCPWFSLTKHAVLNPAGKLGTYSVVNYKNLAIGIVPLDEHYNTWIVGQFRYPLNRYSWEIPEGGGKLSVPPLESAKRELLEETGIIAKRWTKIQEMDLSNSVTDEFVILYIAQDLNFEKPRPEDTEQLQVRKIPFDELYEMVLNGAVTDSLSVTAVLKIKLLMKEGGI